MRVGKQMWASCFSRRRSGIEGVGRVEKEFDIFAEALGGLESGEPVEDDRFQVQGQRLYPEGPEERVHVRWLEARVESERQISYLTCQDSRPTPFR